MAVVILSAALVLVVAVVGFVLASRRSRGRLVEARTEVGRVWERGLNRFIEAADLLPDILVEVDRSQVLTFTNRAFADRCGYSEHDLRTGLTLADLLVPEERPRLQQVLMECRDGRLRQADGFLLRRHDGDERLVSLYVRGVVQRGEFMGWRCLLRGTAGSGQDLPASRVPHLAAEAVIRAIARDFARTPAEHLDEAVGRALATAGAYLGVDRAYLYRALGPGDHLEASHLWYADGVTRLADDRVVPPLTTYPWVVASFERGGSLRVADVTRVPEVALTERQAWRSQGVTALMAVPLRDGDQLTGFLGCEVFGEPRNWNDRDLDVLETIAEICQQVRSPLPRLAELLPDPAFVVDPAGVVVAWNAALESLTGLGAASQVGRLVEDAARVVLGPEFGKWPVQALLAATRPEGRPADVVVHLDSRDPAVSWRLSARPLCDDAGRLLGAIQYVQDVTATALADRHLRRRLRDAERNLHLAHEETCRLRAALEARRQVEGRRLAMRDQAN
jgi:PAS domain S-box-containing protein